KSRNESERGKRSAFQGDGRETEVVHLGLIDVEDVHAHVQGLSHVRLRKSLGILSQKNRGSLRVPGKIVQVLESAKIKPVAGIERDGKPVLPVQGGIPSAREASVLDIVHDERARVQT